MVSLKKTTLALALCLIANSNGINAQRGGGGGAGGASRTGSSPMPATDDGTATALRGSTNVAESEDTPSVTPVETEGGPGDAEGTETSEGEDEATEPITEEAEVGPGGEEGGAAEGGEEEVDEPYDGEVCPLDGSLTYMDVSVEDIDGISTRVIQSSSCPNYDWSAQSTPGDAQEQELEMYLPAEPVLCSAPTSMVGVYLTKNDTSEENKVDRAVQGPIGVSYNGVPIYGNADGQFEDAYVNEGPSFNECNGHNGPGGGYHYHAQVPDYCLLVEPTEGAHSDIFGILADGIPIFGPLGDNGEVPTDLDECNGHVDETHPYYHYHVEAEYSYPYTVNCLMGEINTDVWGNLGATTCEVADTQYDYSFLETEFVSIEVGSVTGLTIIPDEYQIDSTTDETGDGANGGTEDDA